MRRPLAFAAAVLAAAGLLLSAAAACAQGPKIGYVNQDRLIHESAPAKTAEARLRAEFSAREEELREMTRRLQAAGDRLEHESAALSEVDRMRRQLELINLDRDVRRRRRDFQEDLARRKDQELAALMERVTRAVRQIGEAEGYAAILERGKYVSARVDITDRVIGRLNAATRR